MVPEMKPPKCDVYMNVTGSRIKAGTPPNEIVQFLSKQLTKPVLWEHSLRSMIEDEVNTLYDIGPGKQLRGYVMRIKPKMSERVTAIQV
jgi:[acyl-carrier-protein] S-malonyltransferase